MTYRLRVGRYRVVYTVDDVASMFPDDRSVNDGLIREAVASADQDSFVSRQAPITYTVPGT